MAEELLEFENTVEDDDLHYWATGLTYFYLEGAFTDAITGP